MTGPSSEDLVVSSKSVEQVYREYRSGKYRVNRRYQRKLVWTIEEKSALIDSILHQYPLPQFLVAESSNDGSAAYEIIDGMQRLNAIVSFLENEFPMNDHYFDLESLADTKELLDSGELVQQQPKLTRKESVLIATYNIAQSVYRTNDPSSIEDVFRRINSSGQKLSRQDLRQAGTVSPIADMVRVISSRIRGDVSPEDNVPLAKMKSLSISASPDDPNGISPEEIIWVQHGILNRPDMRSSADEQLVLDILADILVDPLPKTGTPTRDILYGFADRPAEPSSSQGVALTSVREDLTWQTMGATNSVIDNFFKAYTRVETILSFLPDIRFVRHIGLLGNNPIPRYFESFFMAVYRLVVIERRELTDPHLAVENLKRVFVDIKMPGGGGEWLPADKEKTIKALVDKLSFAFKSEIVEDGGGLREFFPPSEVVGILSSFTVESESYDAKLGVIQLDPGKPATVSSNMIRKIVRTASAISNSNPKKGGYIILGVADSQKAASAIAELGIGEAEPIEWRKAVSILGIDREAILLGTDINEYWTRITQSIKDTPGVESDYLLDLIRGSAPVEFRGRHIGILRAPEVDNPVMVNDAYYRRVGSSTQKIERKDEVSFIRSFG